MDLSNDNLAEVLKTNVNSVNCIKVFIGSSTGKMSVDDQSTLEKNFQ